MPRRAVNPVSNLNSISDDLASAPTYCSPKSLDDAIFDICWAWANARSKDPKTKVGAAVFDPTSGGLFLGYNGFPPGFPDARCLWDQTNPGLIPSKYSFVIHAEANAVRKALMALQNLEHCVLYSTHEPCHRCIAEWLIPSGIKTVIYDKPYPDPNRAILLRNIRPPLVIQKRLKTS